MNKVRKRLFHIFKSLNSSFINYFGKIIIIVGTIWVLLDASWTSLDIYNYFSGNRLLEKNKYGLILILIFPIALTILYMFLYRKNKKLNDLLKEKSNRELKSDEIIRFHRNIIEDTFDDILSKKPDVLKKDILFARSNQDWSQVIKIGKYGSRLFLMLAQYDMRIEYGKCIIEAAEAINDNESTAIGYIDCIGWSYVMKREYDEAKKNINKGLAYISNSNSPECILLRSKAQRHLSGIELKQGNIGKAKLHRDSFENEIKNLKGRSKRIMTAYLMMISADIIAKDKNQFEEAKSMYQNAYDTFISCNDEERAIKLYYKIGNLDSSMNQTSHALKDYFVGYWLSDKVSRRDEKQKNLSGIKNILTIAQNKALFEDLIHDEEVIKIFKEYSVAWVDDINFYLN